MLRAVPALLFALAGPAGAATDPASAASGFYDVYGAQHGKSSGVPDATARVRYSSVLSPRLNALFTAAAAAQARLSARMKKAVPPMLSGDIFSSSFDGASSWQIGACQGDAAMVRCPVAMGYVPKAAKPLHWTDTVIVAATPQGWKVDDVIYDANFADGNTGSLSDMLKMVISQNP